MNKKLFLILITIIPLGLLSQEQIKGAVTSDDDGMPLPGATVMVSGTTNGTTTDFDGNYVLNDVAVDAKLIVSYIGFMSVDILVDGRSIIDIILKPDTEQLDEVVIVGYGSMKKSDLTGAVTRAEIEPFKESANTSILSSLQGAVPGLNIGATTTAGEQASIQIRGQSTISGETTPLIVLDGVIYRGNLVDINPNDIASIDVLKDSSAAAIYGSQAANGVIILTTHRGGESMGKPTINFSSSYTFRQPSVDLSPSGSEYEKMVGAWRYNLSGTPESGYTEPNLEWSPSSEMVSNEEIQSYENGLVTDWHDLLTNNSVYATNYNLSIMSSNKNTNLMASLGYTGETGYMKNDRFRRTTGRLNFDTKITDWLTVSAQTYFTSSDYTGVSPDPFDRFLNPFAPSHDENGELFPTVVNNRNPLYSFEDDNLEKRLTFFGNLVGNVEFPFIKGLSYRVNYSNRYSTGSDYLYFNSPTNSFMGSGSKEETIRYDQAVDNLLMYKRTFDDKQRVELTLGYGLEKIEQNSTTAFATIFPSGQLGYNSLEDGDATLQKASSGAWEESSLYNMGRLFYSFDGKYLFTGTIRRDGFSGFGEANKFGVFPSASLGWTTSRENFLSDVNWLNYLKLRMSYGTTGNRTIGRYATKARVTGGYNYLDLNGSSIFTKQVSSLSSPNLKWETTTGINVGMDFKVFKRISGNVEYYNNNTTNLLYEVDIPSITRYSTFPDNLGKIHNHGLEFSLTSTNFATRNWTWVTTFNFSRNRDELKELIGLDNDGDGVEDDLVSEGLFIGESLNAIYDYEINGLWQVEDEIPVGYEVGSYKVVDQNGGGISPEDDRKIIGYRNPSYRFSVSNNLRYKNWNLFFFINSAQGGANYFYEKDYIFYANGGSDQYRKLSFPEGLDYWTPNNRDAFYQRPGADNSPGLAGSRYSQRNFIRLQDLTISYNIPQNLLKKEGIQNLKLFFNCKNLFTITDWNGWDPETGITIVRDGIPVMKGYTLGLDLKF
ncbi:SusC/RagA family TonB-linked outer membrane protein [Arenibacter palladensis]|uniref:SusC/RagA family TonB-linked outer membrane protein n=1 Tax=Arenibacter palladensis TaxID=237373 RepID=UPI0026E39BD2|nr:SusC/RagA family TonB-linked outer membrane protein [Arenibacter palladensis]MDO6602848.1 SusC/RagA family TonB-linked outer membrane protein [Arenibacter palladensis]